MRVFFYYFIFCTGLALPVTVLVSEMIGGLLFHKPFDQALLTGVLIGIGLGLSQSIVLWDQRWKECPKCNEKQEVLPSSIRFAGWKCKQCSAVVNQKRN